MKRLVLLLLTVIFVFGHAPQCVIETKDGIIDLNNAKHEKYYQAIGDSSEFQINICGLVEQECRGKKYPAMMLSTIGEPSSCSYFAPSLEERDFIVSLIDSNNPKSGVKLHYTNGENYAGEMYIDAVVKAECDESEQMGKLLFERVSFEGQYLRHFFVFKSKHACVRPFGPGRPIPGLGIGGLLLIIAFVAIIVYFVAGILLNKYKYNKNGLDLIPNVQFWKDVPYLVKDGGLLIMDGVNRILKRGPYSQIA